MISPLTPSVHFGASSTPKKAGFIKSALAAGAMAMTGSNALACDTPSGCPPVDPNTTCAQFKIGRTLLEKQPSIGLPAEYKGTMPLIPAKRDSAAAYVIGKIAEQMNTTSEEVANGLREAQVQVKHYETAQKPSDDNKQWLEVRHSGLLTLCPDNKDGTPGENKFEIPMEVTFVKNQVENGGTIEKPFLQKVFTRFLVTSADGSPLAPSKGSDTKNVKGAKSPEFPKVRIKDGQIEICAYND